MFCPNCGSNIADGSRFCSNCGAVIAPTVQPTQTAPQKKKKSKLVITLLCVVLVCAAIAAVLLFVLKGNRNAYETIYDAVAKTVRMDSMELTIDTRRDSDTYSISTSGSGSDFQFYITVNDVTAGLADGYYFISRDDEDYSVKFPVTSTSKDTSYYRNEFLSYRLALGLITGKDTPKELLHDYVVPMLRSRLDNENSYESTDAANLRSAYAEAVTDFLTTGSAASSRLYTVRQRKSGWQYGYTQDFPTELLAAADSLSNVTSGQFSVTVTADETGSVSVTLNTEAGGERPDSSEKEVSAEDLEKCFDLLLEKMTDEEWMNQCCTIVKTEEGSATVYDVNFRPRQFVRNALNLVKDYLNSEIIDGIKDELDIDYSSFRFRVAIEDGRIKYIRAVEENISINLSYVNGALSMISYTGERERDNVTIYVNKIDEIKFDETRVKQILNACEEED